MRTKIEVVDVRRMLPDGAIGGRADEASPGVDTIDRQRIRARLGVLIAHPPPGSIPITITPQMAEVMLERNLDNRPLSPMHVESLAKEMGKNAWLMNGQSIVFADDGRLNDGQHRLHACIRANAPFASDVRFGVPRESFGVTDRGRKRTAGDIFAINGVKNHKMVAAATALIWRYTEGRMLHGASVTPSPVELYAYYSERPDIEQSVTFGHLFKRLAPPSVMMAMHYVSAQQCRELAGEFFTKTATGVGILSVKEPESRLRARLIDNLSGHARLSEVAVAAFTIKAWNARRAGRTNGTIRWRGEQTPDESFPRAV